MILLKIQITLLEMSEIWKNFLKKLLIIYNKNDPFFMSFSLKYYYMIIFGYFNFYFEIFQKTIGKIYRLFCCDYSLSFTLSSVSMIPTRNNRIMNALT
jgi:hypothetical protein